MQQRKNSKNKTQKQKKRYKLSALLCLIVSFSAVFYIMSLQLELSSRKQQFEEVSKKIVAVEQKNKGIEEILNTYNEKDIIEKIARDEFFYLAPDERVFYDISVN
ncbi:MAG: septum formation initiator family protein [Oscillospiraceae bacterium]